MASFGTNTLLNKAKTTVTDYLGISSTDVIMSPIWTSRDMSSDYFQVKVDSSQNGLVQFRLPESFQLNLKSTFSSLVEGKLGIVSALNKFIQTASAFTGSMISLNTKFTTAQLWEGSSPVSIDLPIEFNATSDVYAEVYNNIIALGKMALPREGNEGNISDILLRAPGPTPLDLAHDKVLQGLSDDKKLKSYTESIDKSKYLSQEIKDGLKEGLNWLASNVKQFQKDAEQAGDNIDITIGNILTFHRCIIPEIKWNFDCTRLLNGCGLPMRVSGTMTFKTTTAMTSNDFEEALRTDNSSIYDFKEFFTKEGQTKALSRAASGWSSSYKSLDIFKRA